MFNKAILIVVVLVVIFFIFKKKKAADSLPITINAKVGNVSSGVAAASVVKLPAPSSAVISVPVVVPAAVAAQVAPKAAAAQVVAPQVVAPQVLTPQVVAPQVLAPQVMAASKPVIINIPVVVPEAQLIKSEPIAVASREQVAQIKLFKAGKYIVIDIAEIEIYDSKGYKLRPSDIKSIEVSGCSSLTGCKDDYTNQHVPDVVNMKYGPNDPWFLFDGDTNPELTSYASELRPDKRITPSIVRNLQAGDQKQTNQFVLITLMNPIVLSHIIVYSKPSAYSSYSLKSLYVVLYNDKKESIKISDSVNWPAIYNYIKVNKQVQIKDDKGMTVYAYPLQASPLPQIIAYG